jgi:hypothetical protein
MGGAFLHGRHKLDHGRDGVRCCGCLRLFADFGECLGKLSHGGFQEFFRLRQLLMCPGSGWIECLQLPLEGCDLVLDLRALRMHGVHPPLLVCNLLLGPLVFLFKRLAIPPGLELFFGLLVGFSFGQFGFLDLGVVLAQEVDQIFEFGSGFSLSLFSLCRHPGCLPVLLRALPSLAP